MALNVKAESFTHTENPQTIDVGFEPKIIIFNSVGTTGDGSPNSSNGGMGFGVAINDDGTIHQRAFATYMEDDDKDDTHIRTENTFGTSSTTEAAITTLTGFLSGSLANYGRVISFDATSFDYDGSSATGGQYDSTSGSGQVYSYLAIGGDDVEEIALEKITCPASTGVVGYSGAGFEPDFILAYGSDIIGDTGTSSTAQFSVGFGDGTDSQYATGWRNDGNNNCTREQTNNSIINIPSRVEADIDAIHSNGIDLNWTTRSTTNGVFGLLYIKGVNFIAADSTQRTTTGTTTVDTGSSQDAEGIFLMGTGQAFNTVNDDVMGGIGFATGVGATESRSNTTECEDTDVSDDGNCSRRSSTNHALMISNTSESLNLGMHINAYDATGLEFDFVTTNGVANPFSYFTMHEGEGPSTHNIIASGGATVSGVSAVTPDLGYLTGVPGSADTTGGGTAWINPTNIIASDDADATSITTGSSQRLRAYNFNFSLPTDATAITGIELNIEVEGSDDDSGHSGRRIEETEVYLLRAGAVDGSNKSNGDSWSDVEEIRTYGGDGTLWDSTWSISDIENSGFGAAIKVEPNRGDGDETGWVDYMEVVVYYAATESSETYNETGSGGAEAAGEGSVQLITTEAVSGGGEVAGDGVFLKTSTETASGGAVASGEASESVTELPNTYNEVGSGGAVCSGEAFNQLVPAGGFPTTENVFLEYLKASSLYLSGKRRMFQNVDAPLHKDRGDRINPLNRI